MTANPFKTKAFANRLQIGAWVMVERAAAVLAPLQRAGLDFARFDMEHTTISTASVATLVRAAEALDFGFCLRPPSGREVFMTELVGLGVRNFQLPQIETAGMAASAVDAARNAESDLRSGGVHITVMLESRRAFDNIDEIAAVDGVDAIGMGPADLAQDLGIYGARQEAPVIAEYQAKLRTAALRHGKQWEMGAWSEADAVHWIGKGCRILTYMTETTVLRSAYQAAAEVIAGGQRTGFACARS